MFKMACAPENLSLLNPGEFRVLIHKAPYLSFFTRAVALPTVNLPSVKSENPFVDIPVSGDHLEYEPLSVVFLVDEDLRGYKECYAWMRGLGFPTTFTEYKALLDQEPTNTNRFEVLSSPISVFTNTGSRNYNVEFIFYDAIPSQLAPPTLSNDNGPEVPVVTAKALFNYTYFDVRNVTI